MRIIIVSGLSGSGKSVALHTLEDEGYYCIDNLPGSMLPELVNRVLTARSRPFDNMAIGVDARSEPELIQQFPAVLAGLRKLPSVTIDILFLETNEQTLIRRFSETRRKHPLSNPETPLEDAIDKEVHMLADMKENASLVVDTSALNLHQLRDVIRGQLIAAQRSGPALLFQSFGFKHGMPTSTDFLFDVRCLPNPYWNPALRHHTGLDQPVVRFLEENESVETMYQNIRDFLSDWLPFFQRENRAYLTVSIGCTGGRHRSVYLAHRLGSHFETLSDSVTIRHRELD